MQLIHQMVHAEGTKGYVLIDACPVCDGKGWVYAKGRNGEQLSFRCPGKSFGHGCREGISGDKGTWKFQQASISCGGFIALPDGDVTYMIHRTLGHDHKRVSHTGLFFASEFFTNKAEADKMALERNTRV